MNFRVVVSPSPFRENFVLGHYESYWRAWLAAFWHITVINGMAEAHILRRN